MSSLEGSCDGVFSGSILLRGVWRSKLTPDSEVGSRYVVMFVDSASRLQRPYGARDKSAYSILAVVKRFVADMGVPGAFRTDNGTEFTNAMLL